MHAATGKRDVNMLIKFAIHAWEKDNLDTRRSATCPSINAWYDKKESINMCKVATPELAQLIITIVKDLCPD